ncbi:MAG: exosortase system-associated protein, TIGR04073 family, partial [Verrucomicrobiaceae bacterium]
MKKILVIATAFAAFSGIAAADIQAPPGSTYTSSRKLGRAISNIVYGFMEIPEQMVRKTEQYGNMGMPYGQVDGTSRALR